MINEFLKRVKKESVAPIYVLHGDEEQFINMAISAIKKKIFADEVSDFAVSTYDLEEQYLEDALEDAMTLPFLEDRKVVIIKNAKFLTTQKEKLVQNAQALTDYLQNLSEETVLIFVCLGEKLDERKKIVKLLKSKSVVQEFSSLKIDELRQYLASSLAEKNITYTKDVLEKFLERVGMHTSFYYSEVEKLDLYFNMQGGELTSELLEEFVPRLAEHSIFELVDSVLERNKVRSIQLFHRLLDENEEPIKIISLLLSQFRLIYEVKVLQEKGASQYGIAETLKVHPFRVKLAMNHTRKYAAELLLKNMRELAEVDYQLKTSSLDKRYVVERFFLQQNL